MEDVPAGVSSLQEAISAADFPLARKAIDKMLIEDGMSGVEIVRHLYRIVNDTGESPAILARILLKIADADLNVRSAANDRIHLERLVTEMANV
jgi:replication factor C small subunit